MILQKNEEAEQNNIIQGPLCEEILNNVEILLKDPESIKNREDLQEIALNPTEYTNKLKQKKWIVQNGESSWKKPMKNF